MYLSYSGLGCDVERGIRHKEVRANFPRLAEADVPVVHYWRPAFPESATPRTMEAVFDWASEYARCTMAAGLKVEPAALARLAALWPELATTSGVTTAECVYPKVFWDFIHATRQRRSDYPLFHTNSCALAYLLGQPDKFGVFDGNVCRSRNHCPTAQRLRCEADTHRRPALTDRTIRAALERRGYADAMFTLDHAAGEVLVRTALPTGVAAALAHDLGARVHVARQHNDPYWNSGVAGADPLVIGGGE